MNNQPAYSVIVPVFNGEQTLEKLTLGLKKVFEEHQLIYEIIFVDDGSADESWNLIRNLVKNNTGLVKGYRLSKGFGQDNAILCGIQSATYETCITIDDDLQF